MKKALQLDLPAKLARGRKRFEQWRSTHPPRSHLPKPLWSLAAELAREYGLSKTARILRLDYYGLKKRVASLVSDNGPPPAVRPAFLELLPGGAQVAVECSIECEDAQGAKIRIHLKGRELPDLAAITSNFWSRDR